MALTKEDISINDWDNRETIQVLLSISRKKTYRYIYYGKILQI
jgi:hypothetical protein